MRARYLAHFFAGAVGFALLGGMAPVAEAQANGAVQGTITAPRKAAKRSALRAKVQQLTPAERKVAKAKARHQARKHARKHARNLTDAQKTWARAARTEAKTLHAAVAAGTLSKDAASAQRKAWRQANPRPKKGVQ